MMVNTDDANSDQVIWNETLLSYLYDAEEVYFERINKYHGDLKSTNAQNDATNAELK